MARARPDGPIAQLDLIFAVNERVKIIGTVVAESLTKKVWISCEYFYISTAMANFRTGLRIGLTLLCISPFSLASFADPFFETEKLPLASHPESGPFVTIFLGEGMMDGILHAVPLDGPSILNGYDPRFPKIPHRVRLYTEFDTKEALIAAVEQASMHSSLIVFHGHGNPEGWLSRKQPRIDIEAEDVKRLKLREGVGFYFAGCNTGSVRVQPLRGGPSREYLPEERMMDVLMTHTKAGFVIGEKDYKIDSITVGSATPSPTEIAERAMSDVSHELLSVYWEVLLDGGKWKGPYRPYWLLDKCEEALLQKNLPPELQGLGISFNNNPFRVLRRGSTNS